MGIDKKIRESKLALFLIGGMFLVIGIVLVLVWWPDVVSLFRGVVGVVIALAGMMILYMIRE